MVNAHVSTENVCAVSVLLKIYTRIRVSECKHVMYSSLAISFHNVEWDLFLGSLGIDQILKRHSIYYSKAIQKWGGLNYSFLFKNLRNLKAVLL